MKMTLLNRVGVNNDIYSTEQKREAAFIELLFKLQVRSDISAVSGETMLSNHASFASNMMGDLPKPVGSQKRLTKCTFLCTW